LHRIAATTATATAATAAATAATAAARKDNKVTSKSLKAQGKGIVHPVLTEVSLRTALGLFC
jgi:hypothetical protein